MASVKAAWHVWTPITSEDKEAIRRELRAISASPHFCNSKRYPALLNYVVEQTLRGRADELKERTLGIEVFERPPDYDTYSDTIVRYTAGEVRKRLSLYYNERQRSLDSKSEIQISLSAGSYVPEFLHADLSDDESTVVSLGFLEPPAHETGNVANAGPTLLPLSLSTAATLNLDRHTSFASTRWYWVSGLIALLVVAAIPLYLYLNAGHDSPVNQFWAPVLHRNHVALLCAGSVVFDQNKITGTATAGKDTDYPFVSFQQADAIGLMGALLDRSGAAYVLQPAASTPLSELREKPIILLGGYNNDWTFRFQDQLRFRFLPEPQDGIGDSAHPGTVWSRDLSKPYSNSDDYAIIARFHDPTTDSMMVLLAGVGRNGTEAAAQFVTSPHYMQELAARTGSALATRNIEVVIKVNVIEGKTGAPIIQAVNVW